MLAVYVWHTVIPRFPHRPKHIRYCGFVSKTVKKRQARRYKKVTEKGSPNRSGHGRKDFLFTAVKDTVQEKCFFYSIYSTAAWKEAGSGSYTVVTDRSELYTRVPSGDLVP